MRIREHLALKNRYLSKYTIVAFDRKSSGKRVYSIFNNHVELLKNLEVPASYAISDEMYILINPFEAGSLPINHKLYSVKVYSFSAFRDIARFLVACQKLGQNNYRQFYNTKTIYNKKEYNGVFYYEWRELCERLTVTNLTSLLGGN